MKTTRLIGFVLISYLVGGSFSSKPSPLDIELLQNIIIQVKTPSVLSSAKLFLTGHHTKSTSEAMKSVEGKISKENLCRDDAHISGPEADALIDLLEQRLLETPTPVIDEALLKQLQDGPELGTQTEKQKAQIAVVSGLFVAEQLGPYTKVLLELCLTGSGIYYSEKEVNNRAAKKNDHQYGKTIKNPDGILAFFAKLAYPLTRKNLDDNQKAGLVNSLWRMSVLYTDPKRTNL